jgi:hypothetical protein
MTTTRTTPTTPALQIEQINVERLHVPIVGTAPLIVHAWSDKAKRQMLGTQQGRKTQKGHRDPQADYESSLYRTETGFGFPVLAFKAATVGAARFFGKSVRMTEIRQFVFFRGVPSDDKTTLLTPIIGEPRIREDMVRVGMGTDLRYRGEFLDWTAVLDVTYVTSAMDRNSVVSLIEAGGLGVGVGEWRPEKNGDHGTYAVDMTVDIVVVS